MPGDDELLKDELLLAARVLASLLLSTAALVLLEDDALLLVGRLLEAALLEDDALLLVGRLLKAALLEDTLLLEDKLLDTALLADVSESAAAACGAKTTSNGIIGISRHKYLAFIGKFSMTADKSSSDVRSPFRLKSGSPSASANAITKVL